jgi:hypothetical protein
MGEPAEKAVELPEPLVIYITRGFDSYTFFVDRDQLDRLEPVAPDRLTLALDLKRPFAEVFEPIHRHVIALLTAQDLDRLQEAGGVEVRDYETRRVLWQPSQRRVARSETRSSLPPRG